MIRKIDEHPCNQTDFSKRFETTTFSGKGRERMNTDSTSVRTGDPVPKRFAFILRLRPGVAQAYEEAHRAVWPELLALLKSAGISEYSIYRRDELLILTLRAVDFEASWSQLENHPVNLKWQETMAPLFAPAEDLRAGERFPMMEEVFYLP